MIHGLSFKKPLNITFLCAGLSLILTCIFITNSQQENIKETFHKQSRIHIRNIASFIHKDMIDNEEALNELNMILTEQNGTHTSALKQHNLQSLLTGYLRLLPNVMAIIVADNEGNFEHVPEAPKPENYDPRKRPWFIAADRGARAVVYTDPYQDMNTKQTIYSLSVPMISNADGHNFGVLCFDIDLNKSENKLKTFLSLVPDTKYVINRKGAIVFTTDDSDKLENLPEILQKIGEYRGQFYLPETKSYYYYQSLGHPDWVVLQKVKSADINALAFNESSKVIYGTGIILLVLLFCWWSLQATLNNIYMRIAGSIKSGKLIDKKAVEELLIDQIKTSSSKMDSIKSEALTDGLTGLKNRRAFDTDLVAQAQIKTNILALVDIDNFKQVNDRYGHATGDIVLKAVAEFGMRLRGLANINLYRYGGEEIAVLFNDMSLVQAAAWLEGWKDAIKVRQFREPGLQVTFSAGLCYMDGHTPEEIIKNADRLLYQAKRTGKDKVLMEANGSES